MTLIIRGSLFADNWTHSDHHNRIIDIYRVKHVFILLIHARGKLDGSFHLKKVSSLAYRGPYSYIKDKNEEEIKFSLTCSLP